ncbi:MAG: hypothetical protein HY906_22160 [Deltaproteobacteria bacterium]|nr:hypothetical protein [Deltaproteobacteria bacterium]
MGPDRGAGRTGRQRNPSPPDRRRQRRDAPSAAAPFAVFTDPEIAAVGLTEAEAVAQGRTVRVGRFPLRALGKAQAIGETDGLVKVIAAAEDDTLLGVHVVGPHAGDLIAEATLALEMNATAEDLAAVIHVHPTLAEALGEAALATDRRALHVVNP